MAAKKNILISEPQVMEMGLPYLPIMWGILKSYWERHGEGVEHYAWLPPIHLKAELSSVLEPYEGTTIDVLGLSCYTWNWHLQCELAARVKELNPSCLVIAGGPEPDYKDPLFFSMHPYLDAVAVKDGEITFTRILEKVLALSDRRAISAEDLAEIPGLYLPAGEGEPAHFTGATEVPMVFDYSPYIDQREFYEDMRASVTTDLVATWETNRGCPFRCSFCDWGSNTMSKVRRFDIGRVRAEIEWLGHMKIGFIMLADANFGMYARDVDIAQLVAETREKTGFPKYFSYNTAKNNPERTVKIAKILADSKLASAHILSIQHTDPAVLAATDRSNISIDKQIQVVRQLLDDGVPIYVQLILGIPGDHYEAWKRCFSDLMEWGVHMYYWIFPYALLPNAPAAEKSFMERWQIKTRDRYVLVNHGSRPHGPINPITETKGSLVLECKTFSADDWAKMATYGVFIKALHNCCVTQLVAIYLRFNHGVPYHEFYDSIIEDFLATKAPGKSWYRQVREHHQAFVEVEDSLDFMDVQEFPQLGAQVDPSRWLFIQICLHLDAFFVALEEHLVSRYPDIERISSVLDYQKNLIILPSYDRSKGQAWSTEHDWVEYFAGARPHASPVTLPEPEPTPGGVVRVTDQVWADEGLQMPLDWGLGSQEDRWQQWIYSVVVGRNSFYKNNFQETELIIGKSLITEVA